MKYIIPILIFFLFSAMAHSQKSNDSFTQLWRQVEKLENEALTKSALKLVSQISEKAKRENNSPQIVKALLYTSKYIQILEEDAQLAIVENFESAIARSKFPMTNVLESYLANLYWQYFQQNRYRFYNRTMSATKVDSTDFRTWDLNTLFQEINIHFEKSLQQRSALGQVRVSDFDVLLTKQKNSEKYRPSLYDILAHTALKFYTSDENAITRPADKFELRDPVLFSGAAAFAALDIDHHDGSSLQLKALKIYRDLVLFHLNDSNPEALAEVDLERLEYIYRNAVFDKKDLHYEAVLSSTAAQYKDHQVTALYKYQIARLYNEIANSYQAGIKQEHQWKRKDALELCQQLIQKYPKSRGAEKSRALKRSIEQKDLQLTIEQHLPLNTPSKLLVSYKNQDDLELFAYSLTKHQLQSLNEIYPIEKKLPFIKRLKLVKQWNAALKNEKDYQRHTTEILLPGLDNGLYIILAKPKDADQTFAFGHTQATDMALLESRTVNSHRFQLINRKDGTPVNNATLKLSYRENYARVVSDASYTTDPMGMVDIPLSGNTMTAIEVIATKDGENAHFGSYNIRRKPKSVTLHKVNYAAFLFTDRSIYRPGQPMYFKGIAIKKTDDLSSVSEDLKVDVILKDVNGQQVAMQQLITNEYGSFKGEIILPENGLPGNFRLEVTSKDVNLRGYTNISVEEYKRPKFETNFEPVTATYRVNDSIRLKGTATAYAGSNITDAQVVYRVKRVVYFPRWYYRYDSYFNNTPQEIAFGVTKTAADGSYEIVFKALPDDEASNEGLPVFSYEVTADVTDINGETRSTSTVVRVGYHTLIATVSLPDRLDKLAKGNTIKISTANLNGEFVAARGTIKIYKLNAPEYVLRKRPWPAPDYQSFTREKFKELFPYEAFDKEDDISQWENGKMLWKGPFDTQKSTALDLGNITKWPSGNYRIVLETRDKFGQLVTDIARTYIYKKKDKALADNQLFNIGTDKKVYKIGDDVELELASTMAEVFITLIIEKNKRIVDKKVMRLSKNKKTLRIPVEEEDLGGFAVNYSFSAYNSFYSGDIDISVPYPSTSLEIETVTFRDKLRPGTEETWSFKIKGPGGDKVAAEVLTAMYDRSLDAFKGHSWNFSPLHKPTYYSYSNINAHQSYGTLNFQAHNTHKDTYSYIQQSYDTFNSFGLNFGYGALTTRMLNRAAPAQMTGAVPEVEMELEEAVVEADVAFASAPSGENAEVSKNIPLSAEGDKNDAPPLQPRKNLKETAFFYPQLHTDEEGNVSINFTSPEALTQWKLQLLAHTKTLESGVLMLESVTQKELMVLPNPPRFLREGDELVLSVKIANLSAGRLSGLARMELKNAVTGKDISTGLLVGGDSDRKKAIKNFEVDAAGNTQLSWRLKLPEGLQAVQYKVVAEAGDFSDGEQNVLPVLTNSMLVTETLPMWVGSNQTKKFTLHKLRDNTSSTLRHHQLTLEMTSNPAWYAVQALPYLMEYPYDCNEQIFARYYANTLASHIVNSNERIQQVFDQWANSNALLSSLEMHPELKSILIQETPWLRDAQSESAQKKRIALLFDLNRMRNEQTAVLSNLKNNQMSSGAWAWFKGGRANRYITQHILTGLGHLRKITGSHGDSELQNMVTKAIGYLDDEFVKEYEQMKKYSKDLKKDHLSNTQVHYLYMRSFYQDIPASEKVQQIETYYLRQAGKFWMNRNLYAKGMLALILHRKNESTATKIIRSLRENSITNEETGMYWKENSGSWYWYSAPIETQAVLIEAFSEIGGDMKTVDNLKIWLLKNKQTNQWRSTKATTEAVYALLLEGSNWLAVDETVTVSMANAPLSPEKLNNVRTEAGSGYFKTSWGAAEIRPEMAEVSISKKEEGIAWGAFYWQYFEDLDKITTADTPLKLKKKLFLKKNTAYGESISEIKDTTKLYPGDLVRIRIELRADRSMEFVHMKDMRASGLEPINVLSQYKWQDGLGYYESSQDASTNFFFDYLPKGVHVFEYDLRVNNTGNFSNGITSIQSMYAPEFSSHSEGVRLNVESR